VTYRESVHHQVVINSNDVLNPKVTIPVNFRMMPEITVGLNDNINTESKLVENIFPNPAKEMVEIRLGEFSGEARIELFNTTGMLVKSVDVNSNTQTTRLELSGLSSGLYQMVIRSGEKYENRKLIVQ